MTDLAPTAASTLSGGPLPRRSATVRRARLFGWVPTWGLIATKNLELRKRRGLMVAVVLLIVGLPVVVLGLRLLFHALDPKSYGPAGSPIVFSQLINPMAEFGFIVAAALGTSAGTTDLTDGVFRHLVITGRSRLALYLARIPAGLAILVPLVALAFTMLCLVTSYEGTPPPTAVNVNGASIPVHLDQAQLRTWTEQHPKQAVLAFPPRGPGISDAEVRSTIARDIATVYREYAAEEAVARARP